MLYKLVVIFSHLFLCIWILVFIKLHFSRELPVSMTEHEILYKMRQIILDCY